MPKIMDDIRDNTENIIEDPIIDSTGCCYDSTRDIKIYSCQLSEDGTSISGYTDEGTKAKYIFDKHKWFYGIEISKLNLITFNQLSEEEHKKISSIGGTHTQDNIRAKRTLNDIAKQMLNVELTEDSIDEILGDSKQLIGDDKSSGAVMIAKMIQQAMAGSFKCAEFVRDTAGYKPKNEVDISADIMTDEDRSLIDKLNKRLTG
jgi:hypothetical protein